MPQMNPMNWTLLFLLFILMFYLVINLWAFHTLNHPNVRLFNNNGPTKNWKW